MFLPSKLIPDENIIQYSRLLSTLTRLFDFDRLLRNLDVGHLLVDAICQFGSLEGYQYNQIASPSLIPVLPCESSPWGSRLSGQMPLSCTICSLCSLYDEHTLVP
jgi:hypothetical protein